jgi:outer membrane protein assembly factor BamB
MADEPMQTAPQHVIAPHAAKEPTPAAGGRRPRTPWFAAVCILGAALVQWFGPDFDHQFANIITAVFLLLATLRLFVWWLGYWKGQPLLRWAPLLGFLTTIAAGAVLLRPIGVSGELIPIFEYRWGTKAVLAVESEKSIERGDSAVAQRALTTIGFNGFYASQMHREQVLPREFATNWESQPPQAVWRQPIGGGLAGVTIVKVVEETPSVDELPLANYRVLTLEQREQEEWVTCYDLETGELLWHYGEPGSHFHPLGDLGPRTTPVVDEQGNVIAMSATGKVWSLNGADGTLRWRVDLLELSGIDQTEFEQGVAWGRAGSPLLVADKVIVPLGGSASGKQGLRSLVALSRQDGQVVWFGGDEQISYASPQLAELAGQLQIVNLNEASVSGHAVDSGEMLWRFPWNGQSNGAASCSNPLVIDANSLLLSKGYRQGAERIRLELTDDVYTVTSQWKDHRIMRTKFTNAVMRGEYAYGLNDGALECIELASGDSRWKQGRSGRYGHGQVILVEDVLLISSEEGELALVAAEPTEFRELARIQAIEGRTWNLPGIVGNIVVLRNTKEIATYRLPQR